MPVAIQIQNYGPPSVLKAREVPMPIPGFDEVVIQVILSAVNRADCEIRSGHWKVTCETPFPYTPGLETIGTIYSKGTGVEIPVGTVVITMMQKLGGIHGIRPGGYQEYVKVPAGTLARVNQNVDPVELGMLGLAGVTAHNGIKKLNLRPGHRVIVMGASGGVGSIAIPLAKSLGAYVIAPVQSDGKNKILHQLGVDEIWDLSQNTWESFTEQKVDAVFEMIGGNAFQKCVSSLKPKGRLCSIGALTGGDVNLSVWDLLHSLQLMGWSSEDMNASELQSAVDVLSQMLVEKTISPPPSKIYPLADAAQAHQDMESGHHGGRLLLKP